MNASLTQMQISTPPPADKPMPFTSHLAELRNRIIYSLLCLSCTTGLAFFYTKPLVHLLQRLVPTSTQFVQLSPGEVFLSSFKLAMFVGLGLSLPFLLYQVFRFVAPGLQNKEKRYVLPLLLLGPMLFGLGVVFGYVAILPLMLTFLLDYGQDIAQNQLSIALFLNFCTGFLFASGLVFQLPLMLLLLSFLNLVRSKQLLQQWKWACVIAFILGAVITPSADPFSQVVMSGSLMLLYGMSIVLIKLFGR